MIDLLVSPTTLDALAWTLIHFLWQGSVIGAVAFIALRIVRPERASTRYVIGVAALGVMLATTAATFGVISRQSVAIDTPGEVPPEVIQSRAASTSTTDAVDQVINSGGSRSISQTPLLASARWRPVASSIVVTIWALGVLALSLRLLGGWMLTRRLAHHAVAAVSPAVAAAARTIANRLQLRRAVTVVESGAVIVPTLVGYVKPVVLLPAVALTGLTPEQLHAILAHELAHVRRHDFLLNVLQSIVETLLFYHPAMWWVSAQVRAEREHCCDDLAVEVCGDRLVYVSALAELTSIARHRAFALAATDGSLVQRVQRLLGRPRAAHEATPAWALLALLVLIIGGMGTFRAAPAESAVVPSVPEPAQDMGTRGSGNMSWNNGSERVSIKWDGAFRLSDDEKDVVWMSDGGWLSIADGLLLASKVELRGVDGRVERMFRRNGLRREWEPEGRLFLAGALDKMIRRSGLFAKERVARLLKQGGTDAVLGEIDRLNDSNYVRRIYYTELVTQATLTEPLVTRILHRVSNEITSNYDKSTLLILMAKLPAVTEPHRVAIAGTAKSLSSNYDLRRTLTAVLEPQPVSTAIAAAVLDAAASLNSNYDRAELLIDVAQRGGLTTTTSGAFMGLVQTMRSSHDQRRVLTAVTSHGSIADSVAVDALKSVGAITSSYDKAETLIKLLDRGGLTDNSADPFFVSAAEISSSYDLGRVLLRATDTQTMTPKLLEGVLRTARRISSSHDRANLLEAVAARSKVEGPARELYVAAARGMGSHDENRALAALVRSEVRR